MSLCLDVGSGTAGIQVVSGIRLTVETTCEPARTLVYTYGLTTQAAVQDDRTFVSSVSFPGLEVTVAGVFDASRMSAEGSLRVQVTDRRAGAELRCDSGPVSWVAKTPPASPSARHGRFCGFTDQGLGLCFDVAGSPKTVGNFDLRVNTACTPPGAFGLSSSVPTAYAIRDDNSFAFERSGTGTTSAGGSFDFTQSMSGAFDAEGVTATGTLRMQLAYVDPAGVRYECDSAPFAWSARWQ
jgi:hypothetical protein